MTSYLIVFPLVYYITYIRHRYRFPVEPVMLIFAAVGLSAIVKFLLSGSKGNPTVHT